MNVSDLSAPLVVVPVKRWTTITEKALRFGMRISKDVVAVHVTTGEDDENALRKCWKRYVEDPLSAEKLRPPELEVIASPYRKLLDPLFGYLKELRQRHPDRLIAVIVPELVESHWYQYPLHNQRATWLKAALLLTGDRRIVVINVPWFIGPHRQIEAEEEQPDA